MPATTFAACLVGMLVGLQIDHFAGRLVSLAGFCASGTLSPVNLARLHLQGLPAMHVGMILGAMVGTAHWRDPGRRLIVPTS